MAMAMKPGEIAQGVGSVIMKLESAVASVASMARLVIMKWLSSSDPVDRDLLLRPPQVKEYGPA
jgi:hypothetical protein